MVWYGIGYRNLGADCHGRLTAAARSTSSTPKDLDSRWFASMPLLADVSFWTQAPILGKAQVICRMNDGAVRLCA